eukprot:PhF_6_TR35077/c0_g1_i1/m.51120
MSMFLQHTSDHIPDHMSSFWSIHNNTWCALCDAPHGGWSHHVSGNREHQALSFIYELLVRYPGRTWNPEAVWSGVSHSLLPFSLSPYPIVSLKDQHQMSTMHSLLRYFFDLGVYTSVRHSASFITTQSSSSIAFFRGNAMTRYIAARCMIYAFPLGTSGQMTALMSMLMQSNNFENVFDIVQMGKILVAEDSQQAIGADRKTFLYRCAVGDLVDVSSMRPSIPRKGLFRPLDAADEVLAQYLYVYMCMCPFLFRLNEYVTRVEKAWLTVGRVYVKSEAPLPWEVRNLVRHSRR